MAESKAIGGMGTRPAASRLDAAPVGGGNSAGKERGLVRGSLLPRCGFHPHQHRRRRGWGDQLLKPITVHNVAEKYRKAMFDQG